MPDPFEEWRQKYGDLAPSPPPLPSERDGFKEWEEKYGRGEPAAPLPEPGQKKGGRMGVWDMLAAPSQYITGITNEFGTGRAGEASLAERLNPADVIARQKARQGWEQRLAEGVVDLALPTGFIGKGVVRGVRGVKGLGAGREARRAREAAREAASAAERSRQLTSIDDLAPPGPEESLRRIAARPRPDSPYDNWRASAESETNLPPWARKRPPQTGPIGSRMEEEMRYPYSQRRAGLEKGETSRAAPFLDSPPPSPGRVERTVSSSLPNPPLGGSRPFLNRVGEAVGWTPPQTWADVGRGAMGAVKGDPLEIEGKITPGRIVRGAPAGAVEALGLIPRALVTMGEFSGILRQGGVATVAHPTQAKGALADSMRTLFSEGNARALDAKMRADPVFQSFERAKGFAADIEGGVTKAEEVWLSRFVKHIPVLGPMVKASNRQFTSYLNQLRFRVFKEALAGWEETGRFMTDDAMDAAARELGFDSVQRIRKISQLKTEAPVLGSMVNGGVAKVEWSGKAIQLAEKEAEKYQAMRRWAGFVNHVTGRGDLPAGDKLNRALSLAMFAPRLLVSYPQTINDLVNPFNKTTRLVRQKIARDLVLSVGSGVTLLGILKMSGVADVETNPKSSDFGKVRVGNQRFNIWAGYQPIARAVAQGWSGEKKNVGTGLMSATDIIEVTGSFLSAKLSPLGGLVRDLAPLRSGERPENFLGEPIQASLELTTERGVGKEGFDRLVPLFWQDVSKASEEEGWKGVGLSTFGAVGIGTQTFQRPEEKFWAEMGGTGRLEEQDEFIRRSVKKLYDKQQDKKAPLFNPPWRRRKAPVFRP